MHLCMCVQKIKVFNSLESLTIGGGVGIPGMVGKCPKINSEGVGIIEGFEKYKPCIYFDELFLHLL